MIRSPGKRKKRWLPYELKKLRSELKKLLKKVSSVSAARENIKQLMAMQKKLKHSLKAGDAFNQDRKKMLKVIRIAISRYAAKEGDIVYYIKDAAQHVIKAPNSEGLALLLNERDI